MAKLLFELLRDASGKLSMLRIAPTWWFFLVLTPYTYYICIATLFLGLQYTESLRNFYDDLLTATGIFFLTYGVGKGSEKLGEFINRRRK